MDKKEFLKKSFPFILFVVVLVLIFKDYDSGLKRDEFGSIITGGTLPWHSLLIGDCFNDLNPEEVKKLAEDLDLDNPFVVSYVSAVPCKMLHNNEVIAKSENLFFDLNNFPSSEEFEKRIGDFCEPKLDEYLGFDNSLSVYEKINLSLDKNLSEYFHFFFPLESSWNSGDRTVICLLYSEIGIENSHRDLFKKYN